VVNPVCQTKIGIVDSGVADLEKGPGMRLVVLLLGFAFVAVVAKIFSMSRLYSRSVSQRLTIWLSKLWTSESVKRSVDEYLAELDFERHAIIMAGHCYATNKEFPSDFDGVRDLFKHLFNEERDVKYLEDVQKLLHEVRVGENRHAERLAAFARIFIHNMVLSYSFFKRFPYGAGKYYSLLGLTKSIWLGLLKRHCFTETPTSFLFDSQNAFAVKSSTLEFNQHICDLSNSSFLYKYMVDILSAIYMTPSSLFPENEEYGSEYPVLVQPIYLTNREQFDSVLLSIYGGEESGVRPEDHTISREKLSKDNFFREFPSRSSIGIRLLNQCIAKGDSVDKNSLLFALFCDHISNVMNWLPVMKRGDRFGLRLFRRYDQLRTILQKEDFVGENAEVHKLINSITRDTYRRAQVLGFSKRFRKFAIRPSPHKCGRSNILYCGSLPRSRADRIGLGTVCYAELEDPLSQRRNTPWDLLRIFSIHKSNHKTSTARELVKLAMAAHLESDLRSVDRIISISNMGIVLGTLLSLLYNKPQAILGVSPVFSLRPLPKYRNERLLMVDSSVFTGFTLLMSKTKLSEFYESLLAWDELRLLVASSGFSKRLIPGTEDFESASDLCYKSITTFEPGGEKDGDQYMASYELERDRTTEVAEESVEECIHNLKEYVTHLAENTRSDRNLLKDSGFDGRGTFEAWNIIQRPDILFQVCERLYSRHTSENRYDAIICASDCSIPIGVGICMISALIDENGSSPELFYIKGFGRFLQLHDRIIDLDHQTDNETAGFLQGYKHVAILDSIYHVGSEIRIGRLINFLTKHKVGVDLLSIVKLGDKRPVYLEKETLISHDP